MSAMPDTEFLQDHHSWTDTLNSFYCSFSIKFCSSPGGMGKPIHAPPTFKLQIQGRSEKKKMYTMMAKQPTTKKAFRIKTGLPCWNHSKYCKHNKTKTRKICPAQLKPTRGPEVHKSPGKSVRASGWVLKRYRCQDRWSTQHDHY